MIELKILERGRASQKFEVYPVTGESLIQAVTARVVTAIFFHGALVVHSLTNRPCPLIRSLIAQSRLDTTYDSIAPELSQLIL